MIWPHAFNIMCVHNLWPLLMYLIKGIAQHFWKYTFSLYFREFDLKIYTNVMSVCQVCSLSQSVISLA